MAKEIKDFGKKIGGARKDVWKERGLTMEDLADMNEAEQNTYIKKDNIWPKPKWEEMISNGEDKILCFWKNEVRKSLPATPAVISGNDRRERYISFIEEIRDAVMSVTSIDYAISVYNNVILGHGYAVPKYGKHQLYYNQNIVSITPKGLGLITNKVLKACTALNPYYLRRQKTFVTFGVPKQDIGYALFKAHVSKHKYDKVHTRFQIGTKDKNCLIVQHVAGNMFYYPFYDLKECEEYSRIWKKDTWFLIDESTREILSYNLYTEEEADLKIEELAREANKIVTKTAMEKDKKHGKSSYTFPHLENIQRVGPTWIKSDHVTTNEFMNTFDFRGGEFGEWMASDAERQQHLDLSYNAFMDLSNILGISPKSITFNGRLSIAFGARGKGGTAAGAAHYEPLRQVINLTRMSGAGRLAHEWGHSLDHYLSIDQEFPVPTSTMTSDMYGRKGITVMKEFSDVMDSILWNGKGNHTEYYHDSQVFDGVYRKSGHGYWGSKCELFARAFDCYVSDRLRQAGIRSDYLTAYADSYVLETENGVYYAYPRGTERERINLAFDKLVEALITKSLL